MLNLCRCDKTDSISSNQQNLQRSKITSLTEAGQLYACKPPMLLKNKLNHGATKGRSVDLGNLAQGSLLHRQESPYIYCRTRLGVPSRIDSERAESTTLSTYNLGSSRLFFNSSQQQCLIVLDDGITLDQLEQANDLEEGEILGRNANTESGGFQKFEKKLGTGNGFTDLLEYRNYMKRKSEYASGVNKMVNTRLPANKVLSMKEYRGATRARTKTQSPEKPSLSKRRNTFFGAPAPYSSSPVRKVTFSKTNTVLIFVKDDKPRYK